jgi:hypothetical protein
MLGLIMESVMEAVQYAMNKVQKDKEDFRKYFEDFISYWTKEAEEIKNREIDKDNGNKILLNYIQAKKEIYLFRRAFELSLSDQNKLNFTEMKLFTSLTIAGSNYRSKHKTIWERLIDNISGIFNIFGKDKD